MGDFDSCIRVNYPNIGMGHFYSWYNNYPPIRWLNEYDSNGFYSLGGHCVWFDNEKDALMFVLRWTQ